MIRRRLSTTFVLTLLAMGAAGSALSQTDETALQQEFEAAMAVFNSADQYDSISQFSAIIDSLESRGDLSPQARDVLARAYFQRAEVHFNFGENPLVKIIRRHFKLI